MASEKNQKNVLWLYSQLNTLTREGVIEAGTAQGIHAYYGEIPENRKVDATVVFTALGLTLVGLGILPVMNILPVPLPVFLPLPGLSGGHAWRGWKAVLQSCSGRFFLLHCLFFKPGRFNTPQPAAGFVD